MNSRVSAITARCPWWICLRSFLLSGSACFALTLSLWGEDEHHKGRIDLASPTSPSVAEPGVTIVTITGSDFPDGEILPAKVAIALVPAKPGSGPSETTTALSVIKIRTRDEDREHKEKERGNHKDEDHERVRSEREVTFAVPSSLVVSVPTPYLVSLSGATVEGRSFASENPSSLTINPLASIVSVTPPSGQPGQSIIVTITGSFSNFVPGVTEANFGQGISVGGAGEGGFGPVTVIGPLSVSAQITIDPSTLPGPRAVVVKTGAEQASLAGGFRVLISGPIISDFNPKMGPIGTLVTVTGNNFVPPGGGTPTVSLNQQGGGSLTAPLSAFTTTSLSFVIPAGAATGPLVVTAGTQTVTSATVLTVTPSTSFTLLVVPPSAQLIPGQSTVLGVTVNSSNGFDGLATLAVSGVPGGVAASFKPNTITAGQTSILTLSAPASQATGTSTLSISASATIDGQSVRQSSTASLQITGVSTSFIGRTVLDDARETPIGGVTVKFLGVDDKGNTTGCSSQAISDAAGNFSLTQLSSACTGPQLISYDGSTAISPPGKFAGVNLSYTLGAGQVTTSPVLIHLPRIDNAETVLVQQNAASDQMFTFKTIPNLVVTVYAGTAFSLQDGSQPNPFPLTAVSVPVDRLPDVMPSNGLLTPFIVAFQPANAVSSQPVAVTFPNILNVPPGTTATLMTLDPTRGYMVPYGTCTVSSDGTRFVPDLDPAHPGHGYGLVHFDWHAPTFPLPANSQNPCKDQSGFCPCCGDPVDLSSGLAVLRETDISLAGNHGSIVFQRIYRNQFNPASAFAQEAFGYGTSHNFAYRLDTGAPENANLINLVTPDGNFLPFAKQADGTWANGTVPSLQGAVLRLISPGVTELRWRDGTTYHFSAVRSLQFFFSTLDSMADPNGNVTTLVNTGGQLTDIIDPVGRTLHLSYDGLGRITQITDPIGRAVNYSYQNLSSPFPQGALNVVQYPDGSTFQYSYDLGGNLTLVTDRRGIPAASNTFDVNGRVTKQVRGDGSVLQLSYKLMNPLVGQSPVSETTVTDGLGRNTVYRFNAQGFVIDITDNQGQITHIARDGANQIVQAQGTAQCSSCPPVQGGDRSYSYDATGNLTSVTDALGNTITSIYNPIFNKPISISDPLGNKTTFKYDGHGNLLSMTDANGKTASFQYDGLGLLTQATDPLGQNTQFAYDSSGNLIKVIDALGHATQFSYDPVSRLVELQDNLGRNTAIAYDSVDRIVKLTNPLGQVTAFSYDPSGNLLSMTDPRGKLTQFTYDQMNRLQSRTDPLGKSDSRVYDQNANLISYIDRRGQTGTFAYDNLDRLTTETYRDSTVTRAYDANGRLIGVADSAGGSFTFTYDSDGRLLASVGPYGSVNYFRDALERVTRRQVAGQPGVDYSYDPVGNLLSASMPQASVSFTYDARNQPISIKRANGVTTLNTFDPLGRVLSIGHALGTTSIVSLAYSYDASGNRINQQSSTAQPLVTQSASATYDDANRLIQRTGTNYLYDANGNLSSESGPAGLATYTWDSRNRLKSIVSGSGQSTTFTYDFAGNLVRQSDNGPASNLTRTFVLDHITDVAYEQSSDGDQFSVLSGNWIDSHFATVHSGGQVEYGLTDPINSTVATVDQAGLLKGKFSYEAFGQTSVTNSSYPFQFTGRIPASANLYSYRARFYNATTGRFISEDPIGFADGDFNLYRYVENNPLGFNDPTGGLTFPQKCVYILGVLVCVGTGHRPPRLPPEPPPPVEQPAPPGGQGPEPPEGGPIPIPSPSFCPTPIGRPTLSPFPIGRPLQSPILSPFPVGSPGGLGLHP